MFKEEKTSVFWVGLIVLGLSSLVLLTEILSYRYYEAGTGVFFFIHLDSVSIIFGAIIFILIGCSALPVTVPICSGVAHAVWLGAYVHRTGTRFGFQIG